MATIKIYGIPLSQNVRKPLAVARQLGLDIENVPVRPQDPAVVAINPCGRVPAMDDNGFCLGESNAIMIHLAEKKPNTLYPEDQERRDLVNQWLFWDVAHWTPSYQPIQFERLVKQLLEQGPPDEKAVEAALVKFAREAGHLNNALQGREWLVGNGPTLADFAVGSGLTHAKAMDLPLSDYPNVVAWNARVMALEGFKKTAM